MRAFFKGYTHRLGLLLGIIILLTACGDSPATPGPTATAVAPVATGQSGPTISATVSPGLLTIERVNLPALTGATELTLDKTITAALEKQLSASGLGLASLDLRLYASDDPVETLTANADSSLTKAGFKFGLPGQTKPLKQGEQFGGFYNGPGGVDVIFTALPISAVDTSLNLANPPPGVDKAAAERLREQLKSKKSVVVVLAGPELLAKLLSGIPANPTPTK